jgi:uncharacterized protein YprB with RNaseH-like and TPR domain
MLRHSFIHARGVGSRTERWLWDNGVRHWDDLDPSIRVKGVGPFLARRLAESISDGKGALDAGDAGYFHRRLPARESWRIYGEFRQAARFLDIETDGAGDTVTVVGVSDGRRVQSYVAGRDLDRFGESLAGARLLVTFNGKAFDAPILRRAFPHVPLPPSHLDLMHVMRSLGLRGGLKSLERQVGLHRGDLDGIGGAHAVALWRRHVAGDPRALEALVQYNVEDVRNLRYLMDWAYNRCLQARGAPGAPFELAAPEPRTLDRGSLDVLRELRNDLARL